MTTRHLDIFYICDESFAGVLATSLVSLFENNPPEHIGLTVYVLLTEAAKETRHRLTAIGEQYGQTVCILDARAAIHEIEALDLASYRGSAMTNLRLYFDRMIPESVHQILYLDADTLVLGDLTPLSDYPMDGKILGMVLDAYGGMLRTKEMQGRSYYNAGVLLIDCDQWRNQNCRQRILDYIQNNGGAELMHPDQDLYNMLCYDEIVRLPIQYNFQPIHRTIGERMYRTFLSSENYYSNEEIIAAREHPVILHMIRVLGTNPWCTDGNLHPDYAIYQHYNAMTAWADAPEMPTQADVIIRIERWLYRWMPRRLFVALQLLSIQVAYRLKMSY